MSSNRIQFSYEDECQSISVWEPIDDSPNAEDIGALLSFLIEKTGYSPCHVLAYAACETLQTGENFDVKEQAFLEAVAAYIRGIDELLSNQGGSDG